VGVPEGRSSAIRVRVGTDDASRRDGRQRGKYWWLRWAIIGVAVVVLAVEVILVWDQLAKAWKSLLSANWW